MTYFRAPTPSTMPPLQHLLDGLVTRDSAIIAKHLGINARTLARWMQSGQAPRVAQLALYWETHHGLAAAHCEAVNGERVAAALARGLTAENRDLRTRVAYLEEIGDFGAANLPLYAMR